MALGIDTICAELVLAQREKNPVLKLHCLLPCVDQDAKWSALERERYQSILEQADSIIYVNRANKKNGMLERDRFLVNWSTCLLAVYNGEKRGGTAATVNYARKAGRKIWIVNPVTQDITFEDTTALVESLQKKKRQRKGNVIEGREVEVLLTRLD